MHVLDGEQVCEIRLVICESGRTLSTDERCVRKGAKACDRLALQLEGGRKKQISKTDGKERSKGRSTKG